MEKHNIIINESLFLWRTKRAVGALLVLRGKEGDKKEKIGEGIILLQRYPCTEEIRLIHFSLHFLYPRSVWDKYKIIPQ